MKNNALILMWNGNSLPDYLIGKIAEILTTNNVCIPEMLTIKLKDEEAIAKALIRDSSTIQISQPKNEDVSEAVKSAVVYIGTRFADSLRMANGAASNMVTFAVELTNAVISAKRNISFVGVGSNDELLTAIEILSTTNAIIPSSLAKKYHFSQNVVNVIKKVYQS